MIPYTLLTSNTSSPAHANDVSLSLFISIAALRLVNAVERSVLNLRRKAV